MTKIFFLVILHQKHSEKNFGELRAPKMSFLMIPKYILSLSKLILAATRDPDFRILAPHPRVPDMKKVVFCVPHAQESMCINFREKITNIREVPKIV